MRNSLAGRRSRIARTTRRSRGRVRVGGDRGREKAPRPKASDERVAALLAAAGYAGEVTPGVLEAHRRFASHAGKPGLPRWKAAIAVLNGAMGAEEVPHVREIYAEEKRRRETRRPALPKASDELVRELLTACGYNREVTPEVLDAHRWFATHATKPGLPRWKAAVAVLNGAMGADEVPHVREIYAEEKRRREARRARAAQLREQAEALADVQAEAAREQVARVWAETGEGPTWRELASALGVKGRVGSTLIEVLHERGLLISTKESRSLAVGP